MFRCFDAQLSNGENPQLQHTAIDQAFVKYRQAPRYTANGLMDLLRAPHLAAHVAPPLIISKEELLDGFDRQDEAVYSLVETRLLVSKRLTIFSYIAGIFACADPDILLEYC
jgi:hypothetical protein